MYGGYALGARFETVGNYLDPNTWIVVVALFFRYLRRVLPADNCCSNRGAVRIIAAGAAVSAFGPESTRYRA